jgi:hypothetical protein
MWPTQHNSGDAVGSRSACRFTGAFCSGRRVSQFSDAIVVLFHPVVLPLDDRPYVHRKIFL